MFILVLQCFCITMKNIYKSCQNYTYTHIHRQLLMPKMNVHTIVEKIRKTAILIYHKSHFNLPEFMVRFTGVRLEKNNRKILKSFSKVGLLWLTIFMWPYGYGTLAHFLEAMVKYSLKNKALFSKKMKVSV